MPTFQPKDIIAILIISMIVLLKMAGKDGVLDPVMLLLVGYYFAKRNNREDRGI